MKVRFFGSSNCRDCLKLLIILKKFDIDFEYIDAFDDDTQELCDEQEVEELPHIQFLDNNKDIIIEHVGSISEKEFRKILIIHFSTS